MQRAFILQPTYRIEGGRPVVLLYGKLDAGGSFLVRDTREIPHFWIRAADADRAAALGARVSDQTPTRRTLGGDPALRVDLPTPAQTRASGDRLRRAGLATFEADVRFAYRYLIDRGIRSTLTIEGPARRVDGIDAVFDEPELRASDHPVQLSTLSLDIETDPKAGKILSIALVDSDHNEVLLLTPQGMSCPPSATPCSSEAELLETFACRVREWDPDILTGWHVIDFDLAVLLRRADQLRVPLQLGRGPGPLRVRRAERGAGRHLATIPGRVVLDGIQLLRGAFVRLDSYSLNNAAHEILGRGKTIVGADRAEAILRAFEDDRPHLVEYNLNDARLVLEILERLKLVELTVERSRLTGMPPDRVAASIASFDFLYLSELGRRGIVAPTVDSNTESGPASGGHVLDPRPGLYRNVAVLDFKSLYPSIIRTFQIDPLGLVRSPSSGADLIVAPNRAAFSRRPGILPGLLDELMPRRDAARARGDDVASQAIKILMNSFYGVLGTSACRFADPALANAITGFGRKILLSVKRWIEERGYEVLYGDTDSLFVRSGEQRPQAAERLARELVLRLNEQLAGEIREVYGVRSRLVLEFERLYVRLLLPAIKHGSGGARKRYAGLVRDGDGSRVIFTGMEVVRRDWTSLARRVQRELYERLFADRPVDDYLREVVAELRAGRLDEQLVYRKALRKRLGDYTASSPPHVVAARRMTGKPGRIISYVMTRDGAEPTGQSHGPLDYEHYVQKQIRAVAVPVLELLGDDFDRVIGDDTQLRLF